MSETDLFFLLVMVAAGFAGYHGGEKPETTPLMVIYALLLPGIPTVMWLVFKVGSDLFRGRHIRFSAADTRYLTVLASITVGTFVALWVVGWVRSRRR